MNAQGQISAAVDVLANYLRRHGMRCTQERSTILECIMNTEGHFTYDQLAEKLRDCGFRVSTGTIYNSLQLFVDCGLLRSLRFGNGKPCYEKMQANPGHHHLVCTVCGSVRETKAADLGDLILRRNLGKFAAQYYSLTIYGVCAKCRRAGVAKKKQTQNHI